MFDRRPFAVLALALTAAAPLCASGQPAAPPDLPLEELLQAQVETASRKTQRVQDVPAAVQVIGREDIERSGVNSLPEALRLVPGVQVARLSNNRWAVSARGFNGRFANKLLVLMDGRSIYSPLFGGVLWEMEDTLLEDVERIEVIRGPQAALWGANAVNGVINIITRHSRDTRGTLLAAGAGSEDPGFLAARQGFPLAGGDARIWLKAFERDPSEETSGRSGNDDWRAWRLGARGDWALSGRQRLTVSATTFASDTGDRWNLPDLLRPTGSLPVDLGQKDSGAHLLARHRWLALDGAETVLQAYVDRAVVHVPGIFRDRRTTTDLDFQHRLAPQARHDLLWGLSLRHSGDHIESGGSIIRIDPSRRSWRLASAFVQDEISLQPERLRLIAGLRIEHDNWSGAETQPNLRLAFTPSQDETLWASWSRAVHRPSRADLDATVDLQVMPGNAAAQRPPVLLRNVPLADDGQRGSERVAAVEAGWRRQIGASGSIDLALFHHRLTRLTTTQNAGAGLVFTPVPHVVQRITAAGIASATVRGVELAADWRVLRGWRLQAAYSYLELEARTDSADPAAQSRTSIYGAREPRHQAVLRSWHQWGPLRADAALRHVGRLQGVPGVLAAVDAYTTLDLRLAWRLRTGLELSLAGHNLLDDGHVEFVPDNLPSATHRIARSVLLKAKWEF